MMKKGYLVLGLIFFLSNIFVFDLVHLFHINSIKKEAQANLKVKDYSQASVFVVRDLSELNWIESRYEFEKEGMLYDVYGIVQVSDGYKIYARSDRKEAKANARWAAFKKAKNDESSKDSNSLPTFQSFPFLKPYFELHFWNQNAPTNYALAIQKPLISAPLRDIPIPPPEFC